MGIGEKYSFHCVSGSDAYWMRDKPPYNLPRSVTLNDFVNPRVVDEAQPVRAVCARPYNRYISKELTEGPELIIHGVHSAISYCMAELMVLAEHEQKLFKVKLQLDTVKIT